MGISKQKPGSEPIGPGSSRRPVRRDYVEEVQRHAGQLNEAIENSGKKSSGDEVAGQRQRQIQRHLAQLRGEAVQARRLAEQIDNLSQETTAGKGKRKHAMTNTSTIDAGHKQRLKRRASDKPTAGGRQSRFNPLHPSMELPPEQLIRLLGLEDKKDRKKRQSSATATSTRPAIHGRTEKADKRQTTTIEQPAPPAASRSSQPSRRRQRERTDTSVFGEQRRGLLLPALGLGVVAGIGLSVYLFWGQPEPQNPLAKPAAQTSKPVAASMPAPLVRKPAAAVTTNAKKKKPAPADNPKWRAAIRAQEQRLDAAAKQRLNERIQHASQSVAADAGAAVVKPNTIAETPAPPMAPIPAETMTTQSAVADPLTEGSTPGDLAAEPETTGRPAQPSYSETPDPAAGNAGTGD